MADQELTNGAPVAENGTSMKDKSNGKRGGKDEVPIEELYDLSKPIPKVSFVMISRENDLCRTVPEFYEDEVCILNFQYRKTKLGNHCLLDNHLVLT